MSRESAKKMINGNEWEVLPWDGMHGLKMQAKLGRVIGPVLGSAGGSESVMDADVQSVITALADRIDERETPELIRAMLHGTSVEGKDITIDRVFNEHFSANYGELYQGLMFIVQVNFGDLFSMVAAIGGRSAATE